MLCGEDGSWISSIYPGSSVSSARKRRMGVQRFAWMLLITDVQAIVLISLEVSTDVSEIRPTPASGKRGGNWVAGRVRLVLRS